MSTPPPSPPARKRVTLLALCLAAYIISLDVTIVNVALPSLVRQAGATTTDLQWVVDAYNLVFAALVLVAGSLSDRLGRKGMLLAGRGVFGAASLAGSLATSIGQLIGARAVMGLGLWGATTGVGIATGPIIGGWLLEHYWWGSVFLFMVPVTAGVAALAAWAIPTSRDPRTPKTDWRGLILSAAGMGVLVLGIIQAPATEAIMGAVPKQKAGVGSAVNDATRLFGGTLGVAVIGSVAASLYTSRLAATLPAGLPARAITAARGSVGGAVAAAAQKASQAGFIQLGSRLNYTAILAFLHGLSGGCLVAGAVAAVGALVAIFLLPARPADSTTGQPDAAADRSRPAVRERLSR